MSTVQETPKPKFILGVLSMGIGTLIPMIFAFVGVLYAVRALDQHDYGVYMLLLVILQWLSTISELGLATALVREMHARFVGRRDDLINSILCFEALLLLGMSVVAILARPIYFALYNYKLLLELAFFLPPMLILTNMTALLFAVMQGVYQYADLAKIKVATAALRLIVLLVLILHFKMGIVGLIAADLLGQLVAAIWAYTTISMRRRWMIDMTLLKSTLRFALPLYMNSLLHFVYTRIDLLMVGAMIGPAGVAACSVAQRVPQHVKTLLTTSFSAVFFPRMSELLGKDEQRQAEELLNTSLRVMGFANMLIASVIVLFRSELTVLLFSEKYRESALAFAIFVVALFFAVTGTIMGHTLIAAGHSSAPLKVNFVTIITNVIGNLIMIPRWGFTGAAWATLLMGCAALPVNQWFLTRCGYRVYGWDYLKPLLVLVILIGLDHFLDLGSLWLRGLLLLFYPGICVAISRALRQDLVRLVGQSREILYSQLQRTEAV